MNYGQPSCAPHLPAAQGAVLKDADLVRWLQNKLQDRDKWAGRDGVQYVSREMIEELMTCFSTVENPTRLKIILSFLYIGPRNSKQWKDSLTGLLNIARGDPDDWVEVISELFRDIPMGGGTKTTIDCHTSYQKMLDDLKHIATEHEEAGNLRTDPPSMDICSAEVIKGLFDKEPEEQKHFILRKKPKSEALLQEIKKQCENLHNQKRDKKEAIISGSLPIKIRSTRREANNSLPMRGIPTQNTVKLSQGFTNEPKKFQRPIVKREGGAKMIDIAELPMSLKQRRQAEREDEQRRAREEKERARIAKEEEKKATIEAKRQAQQKAKEEAQKAIELRKQKMEQAAAKVLKTEPLKSPPPKTHATKRPSTDHKEPERPARPTPQATTQPRTNIQPQAFVREQQPLSHQDMPDLSQPAGQQAQQQQLLHHPQQRQIQQQQRPVIQQKQAQQQQQQQQPQQQQLILQPMYGGAPQQQQIHQQSQQVYNPNLQRPVIIQNYPGGPAIQIPSSSQQQPQQAYLVAAQPPPTNSVEFQDLEVARKCQEILHSANALDDHGRNLVIQFMKGALRCNGVMPNMEHIMTLKLSENIEDGLVDGRVTKLRVEVFFQMDLSNGEWKRLRKCRMFEGVQQNDFMNQQQQPQQLLSQQQQWHTPQFSQQPYH